MNNKLEHCKPNSHKIVMKNNNSNYILQLFDETTLRFLI